MALYTIYSLIRSHLQLLLDDRLSCQVFPVLASHQRLDVSRTTSGVSFIIDRPIQDNSYLIVSSMNHKIQGEKETSQHGCYYLSRPGFP